MVTIDIINANEQTTKTAVMAKVAAIAVNRLPFVTPWGETTTREELTDMGFGGVDAWYANGKKSVRIEF